MGLAYRTLIRAPEGSDIWWLNWHVANEIYRSGNSRGDVLDWDDATVLISLYDRRCPSFRDDVHDESSLKEYMRLKAYCLSKEKGNSGNTDLANWGFAFQRVAREIVDLENGD
jgi:hypothetical protein